MLGIDLRYAMPVDEQVSFIVVAVICTHEIVAKDLYCIGTDRGVDYGGFTIDATA